MVGKAYVDGLTINYSNDNLSIDFSDAESFEVDQKVTLEGTLDNRSQIVTPTRSDNLNEPIEITITLQSQCRNTDGTNVVDQLQEEYLRNIQTGNTISKGTLVVVDNESGLTSTFNEAYVANGVIYDARTIGRGGQTASYTVKFMAAREIIN